MKTFRWTVPEPHHPPSPMGRSINADEDEAVANIAQKLELTPWETKVLQKGLRGWRQSFSSAVLLGLFAILYLHLGWEARWEFFNWGAERIYTKQHGCLLASSFFIALALMRLVEGVRKRKLLQLLEKIAAKKALTVSEPH